MRQTEWCDALMSFSLFRQHFCHLGKGIGFKLSGTGL
ncbi:Uncharacterised protein [Vibrio cholerae]|nr:Uncharacterised protein [Vibrio cholerae]CSI57461.1 Uncharacterised protein [Vibrio cholerae]